MSYNLTSIAVNSTGMLTFMQSVNTVLLGGWMGVLILIGVCSSLGLAFYYMSQDIGRTVAATSFIAFGLSIFLRAMSLLGDRVLFITLIGAAIAIAFTYKNS